MLDWDQLQAEVIEQVSVLCRDQILRSPPRKGYSPTYGTTVTFSPLASTHLASPPTYHGPDGTISWNTGRMPLSDASNTTPVHTKAQPTRPHLDGGQMTDLKLMIQETESRMQDEMARVAQRWEDRMTDSIVRSQANKLAIDRLAIEVEGILNRTQVLEERATRLADMAAAQAGVVQKVEGAQARQASLNDHLNTSVEDMAHKVADAEKQVVSAVRVLQRKVERSEVEDLVATAMKAVRAQLAEDSESFAASFSQMAARAAQDGVRALRLLSKAAGVEGVTSSHKSLDHFRALIDNNEVTIPFHSPTTTASSGHPPPPPQHQQQPVQYADREHEVAERSREFLRKLADVNQRLVDVDSRLATAIEEERRLRTMKIQECRETLVTSQGQGEAALRRELKALEKTMHSDTSELRQLVESQSRLGKVLEEQCHSLDRWIQTMEQHMGKESKEMNQLRHDMGKRIDEAYSRLETQMSDLARVEREHRLNGSKELSKELQEILHMQSTLETKVQRCHFDTAKSLTNSNELRSKLDDAVEFSKATATRLHDALDAFNKLNAQQDTIRSVIEMTANLMVTMSQRTVELAATTTAAGAGTLRNTAGAVITTTVMPPPQQGGAFLSPTPPPEYNNNGNGGALDDIMSMHRHHRHHPSNSSVSKYGGQQQQQTSSSSATAGRLSAAQTVPPSTAHRAPFLTASSSSVSAASGMPSRPSASQLQQLDQQHQQTAAVEGVGVVRSKGLYRGESMDSVSDVGARAASSGSGKGEEDAEEEDMQGRREDQGDEDDEEEDQEEEEEEEEIDATPLERVASAGSHMATDEERMAARKSFDRDWGGRRPVQSLEDELGNREDDDDDDDDEEEDVLLEEEEEDEEQEADDDFDADDDDDEEGKAEEQDEAAAPSSPQGKALGSRAKDDILVAPPLNQAEDDFERRLSATTTASGGGGRRSRTTSVSSSSNNNERRARFSLHLVTGEDDDSEMHRWASAAAAARQQHQQQQQQQVQNDRGRAGSPAPPTIRGEDEEDEDEEEEQGSSRASEENAGQQRQQASSFDDEEDDEDHQEEEEEQENGDNDDAADDDDDVDDDEHDEDGVNGGERRGLERRRVSSSSSSSHHRRGSSSRRDEDVIPTARAGTSRILQPPQELDNCRQCLKSFPKSELDWHMKEKCRLRYVACPICATQVRFLNLEGHIKACREQGGGGSTRPSSSTNEGGSLNGAKIVKVQREDSSIDPYSDRISRRFNAHDVAPHVKGWNRKQLFNWLTSLGMSGDIAQILYEYRIDGSCFLILTDWELENAEEGLGIQDAKMREQVLEVIEALVRADPDSSGSSTTNSNKQG